MVLELLHYWKSFPPVHILLKQVSGAFGVTFRGAGMSEVEKTLLNQPAASINDLPPAMREFAQQYYRKVN